MKAEELLKFCEERGVEVFERYDIATERLIIRMRKADAQNARGAETEVSIDRVTATAGGYGLTLRLILREMANKLDKEVTGRAE